MTYKYTYSVYIYIYIHVHIRWEITCLVKVEYEIQFTDIVEEFIENLEQRITTVMRYISTWNITLADKCNSTLIYKILLDKIQQFLNFSQAIFFLGR